MKRDLFPIMETLSVNLKRFMNHDLATFRKQSIFSQQDIADMLGTYDAIQISRHELKNVSLQVELLLLYHVLYKKTLEQFFQAHLDALKARLRLRIPNIIDEWKCQAQNASVERKIDSLERILSDLNQTKI